MPGGDAVTIAAICAGGVVLIIAVICFTVLRYNRNYR